MQDKSVLVLGAASWNRMVHVPRLPQGQSATIFDARETESVGSTGVGKSMVLAALGCTPIFHCALGRDAHADLVTSACKERNIRMIVDAQDAPTPHHLNIMDDVGGRYSIFLSNGSTDPVIDDDRIRTEIEDASTIFLSLSTSSKKILPLLKDVNAEILVDLHDYDGINPWYDGFIECGDVLQVSDVALRDPVCLADRLLSGRAHQVVITKGDMGAEIVTAEQHISVSTCNAEMVDSNGAGDAFSVALWYAQRSGLALEEAGRFAAAAASIAIEDATLFPSGIAAEHIHQRALF